MCIMYISMVDGFFYFSECVKVLSGCKHFLIWLPLSAVLMKNTSVELRIDLACWVRVPMNKGPPYSVVNSR